MRRRGFTIVELVVVMTIMAILLVLTVVGISATRVNARDTKRKNDVESLARGLEIRYNDGNPKVSGPAYVTKGTYPGVYEIQHMFGQDMSSQGFIPGQIPGGYLPDGIPGTGLKNYSPDGSLASFTIACPTAAAACANEGNPATVTNTSDPEYVTINEYVYEPIGTDGKICQQGGCVRFNLYYRTEKDNTVQVVKSKHQ